MSACLGGCMPGSRSLIEGWVCLIPGSFQGWVGMSRGAGILEGGARYTRGVGMYNPPSRHETWDIPPPVLKPSGDHHNTHGWQMGGTHPTGMLSGCLLHGELLYTGPNQ